MRTHEPATYNSRPMSGLPFDLSEGAVWACDIICKGVLSSGLNKFDTEGEAVFTHTPTYGRLNVHNILRVLMREKYLTMVT